MEILALSFVIDLILGDPPNIIHPVHWLGLFIEKLERLFIDSRYPLASGVSFGIVIISSVVVAVFLVLKVMSPIFILNLIISATMLKFTYARRSMVKHIKSILSDLKESKIKEAREKLSMIVRRDTSSLDAHLICSACIETISEGFVDGFLSPVFYYGFLGVAGAFLVRTVNTLDSMIGYRNERYEKFGKFSAIADTVLNFIPARLSAFLFAVFSKKIRNVFSSQFRKSARSIESINAGWPMLSMAIATETRLEKKGAYVLNPSGREPTIRDVERSLRIFNASSIVSLLFTAGEIIFTYSLIMGTWAF